MIIDLKEGTIVKVRYKELNKRESVRFVEIKDILFDKSCFYGQFITEDKDDNFELHSYRIGFSDILEEVINLKHRIGDRVRSKVNQPNEEWSILGFSVYHDFSKEFGLRPFWVLSRRDIKCEYSYFRRAFDHEIELADLIDTLEER